MNAMNVPSIDQATPDLLLAELATTLTDLAPEVRKAAAYVLEHPNDVGVSSVREIAEAADVKPNTVVRMARSVGLDGYEDFREPFRKRIRRGNHDFPDRARWLQSLSKGGKLSGLYAEMAESAIANIEQTFSATGSDQIMDVSRAIVSARRVFVLGVGANYMLANYFAYLADMALDNIEAIPKTGSTAIDDLARGRPDDVLIAMTFKPYRTEVVETVELASAQGIKVIALSDSAASPIVIRSKHSFILHSDTPQFFPSVVAAVALLETLIAFVIAEAGPSVVADIERFHERRHELGIYTGDKGGWK